MKKLLVLFLVVSCGKDSIIQPVCHARTDNKIRKEVFMECLKSVPKGPERTTTSNDWDEVVDSCGTQAYYIAQTGCDD